MARLRLLKKNLFTSLAIMLLLLAGWDTFAANSGVTYQGRILKPDGTALSGANTQFKLQIRTPDSQNCLMYEELQSQDLRNSNGLFSLTINDGTGSRTDSTGLTLDKIFANHGTFTLDPTLCSAGAGSYTPNSADGRNLVVLFKDETMSAWEPIPAQKINFVPFAFEAKQVAGFTSQSLVRVAEADGTLDLVSPLSNAQYTELLALVNGTTTQYSKASQLGGVALPTMNSGEVLGWNGTAWVSTAAVGGANSVSSTMLQASSVTTNAIANNVSISTTGTLASAITTTRDFKIYAASPSTFAIDMQAPALSASYSLVWPSTAGSANQVLTTDGSGNLSWAAPASSSQWTTSGSNIYYNTGNVGIGTTSPVATLTVAGTFLASGAIKTGPAGGTGDYLYANFGSPVAGAGNIVTGGAYPLILGSGSGERVRIDTTGNVGIGTTSPNSVFHIYGANTQINQIETTGSTNNSMFRAKNDAGNTFDFRLNGSASGTGIDQGAAQINWPATSNLTLYGGGVLRMQVTSAGKVGIGTTSPMAAFDVNAGGSAYLYINGTDAGFGTVATGWGTRMSNGILETYATDLTLRGGNGTSSNQTVRIYTSNTTAGTTEKMRVDANGNVGIGTTAPTAKLNLPAGTATAGTAPLKFTQGTLLTTPEDGAMEYDSSGLWFTIGSTRYTIPTNTTAGNYSNVSTINNSSGSITMSPMAGNSVIVNATTTSTSSSTGALVVNGGAGVAGALNTGGNITSGGSVTATTNVVTPQLYGSTAASGNIKIDGTSNATPGNVLLASAGGNVGVGTTSPSDLFSVYGGNISLSASSNTATSPSYQSTSAFDRYQPKDNGGRSGVAANSSFYVNLDSNNDETTANFIIAKGSQLFSAGAELFRVQENGNVGIGTTSPTYSLDVNSGTSSSTVRVNSTNPNATLVDIQNSNATPADAGLRFIGSSNWTMGVDHATNNFILGTGTNTPSALAGKILSVSTGGNVGIGTTSPSQLLEVSGAGALIKASGSGSVGFRTTSSSNSARSFDFYTDGNTAYVYENNSATGALVLKNNLSATPVSLNFAAPTGSLYMDSSGNVGIGTTSPSAKLTIGAGTATAGTAPLKFSQGTLLTTPEDGAMEYTSAGLWFTIGSTRYVIPTNTAAGNYSNVSTISNASGSITMSPMAGNSVIVNATTVSTSSSTGALIVNGGAGIAGALNTGGNITSGGAVTATTNMVTPQLYGSTAASGNIKIDGTSNATPGNVLLASAGGSVGVGTTSPAAAVDVQNVSTSSSSATGISGWIEANPSATSTGTYMNYLGAATTSGNAKSFSSGGVDGLYTEAYHQGTGTLGTAIGVGAAVLKNSTGPVTNAFGLYTRVSNTNATGAITNAYGLYVDAFVKTGAITNPYGIYVADTVAPNYFGGKVGIGTTSPSSLLHVSANTSSTVATFANASNGTVINASVSSNGTAISATASSGTAVATNGGSGIGVSATSTNKGVYSTGTNGGVGVYASGAPNSGSSFGIGTYTEETGTSNVGYALQVVNNSATGWGIYANGTSNNYFGGNVGIGTTSPSASLHAVRTTTTTSGAVDGAGRFETNYIPASAPSAGTATYNVYTWLNTLSGGSSLANLTAIGGNYTVNHVSAVSLGQQIGFQAQVLNGNSGAIGTSTGVAATTSNNSSGSMSQAIGVSSQITNSGSGTISNANGFYVPAPINSGGGAITNFYGVKIDAPTVATNNYAIYSGGGVNYFGGNVGIGTTSPSYLLHAALSSASTTGAQDVMGMTAMSTGTMADTFGGSMKLSIQNSGSALNNVASLKWYRDGADNSGTIQWDTKNAGTFSTGQLVLKTGGNVGVGVSSPTTKLQVAGTISPSVDATYDLGTSSLKFVNVYATSGVVNTSDARMKKDIQPSDLGLDFINQLRPVSYYWKEGSDTKLHYGLIAQETKSVIADQKAKSNHPDQIDNVIVTHDEKTDAYGLRYTELISPMIKAIQEMYDGLMGVMSHQSAQDREIASVKASDAAKDQEIQKLKQENAAIKAYLCAKDPAAPICK